MFFGFFDPNGYSGGSSSRNLPNSLGWLDEASDVGAGRNGIFGV